MKKYAVSIANRLKNFCFCSFLNAVYICILRQYACLQSVRSLRCQAQKKTCDLVESPPDPAQKINRTNHKIIRQPIRAAFSRFYGVLLMNEDTSPRFYTPCDVKNILKCSRGYIYKLIKHKGFPKPIYLSPRCRRWKADDVDSWCAERCRCKGE